MKSEKTVFYIHAKKKTEIFHFVFSLHYQFSMKISDKIVENFIKKEITGSCSINWMEKFLPRKTKKKNQTLWKI
jgi:hypothetical protein